MTAIPFVRRTANERVDGTLTVKIDIEPMYKLQFLQMFPEIGAAGALAALAQGVNIEPQEPEPQQKPGQLCIMACKFCADPDFQDWLNTFGDGPTVNTETDAKVIVCEMCGIDSRKELDTNKYAATRFHTLIREPFMAWRASK